jgi:hypothetical protein
MRATRQQAEAAEAQVDVMRTDAAAQREHRQAQDALREQEDIRRDQAVRDQIAALANITEGTRDAARAEVQPIVFANAHGPGRRGPNDDLDLGEGEIAFAYYLTNEGPGVALNVKHGVKVGGVEYRFGGGMEFRTARPGEVLPPLDDGATEPVPSRFLTVVVPEHELPDDWRTLGRTYWTRFENVFGEQFETRNPDEPRRSATFLRLT